MVQWVKYFLKSSCYFHTRKNGCLWQPIFMPFKYRRYSEWQNSKLIWWFNAAGLWNVAKRSRISHNNIWHNELKSFLKSYCRSISKNWHMYMGTYSTQYVSPLALTKNLGLGCNSWLRYALLSISSSLICYFCSDS